jgi:hypothetical protein
MVEVKKGGKTTTATPGNQKWREPAPSRRLYFLDSSCSV